MISEINLTGPAFRPCSLRMNPKGNALDAAELNALKPAAGAMARMLEKRMEAIGKWLRELLEPRIEGADKMTDEQLENAALAAGFEARCIVPPNPEPGFEYFILFHGKEQLAPGLQLRMV